MNTPQARRDPILHDSFMMIRVTARFSMESDAFFLSFEPANGRSAQRDLEKIVPPGTADQTPERKSAIPDSHL
jgi:hypothetical protein